MPFCIITTSAKEVLELQEECYFPVFLKKGLTLIKGNFVATERNQRLQSSARVSSLRLGTGLFVSRLARRTALHMEEPIKLARPRKDRLEKRLKP
jgi:hypothetical protein